MHDSLRFKVILWFAVVVAAVVIATWFGYQTLSEQIRSEAEQKMDAKMEHIIDVLEATDQVYTRLIRASMSVFIRECSSHGEPTLNPPLDPGALPTLYFGAHRIADDFSAVDRVAGMMGGTATLFARVQDRFVRVSTNVLDSDGRRVVGTELDPDGAAIRALYEGKAFYGVVDVLGKAYITGYEPIIEPTGEVVGAYYVGYALDTLDTVREALDVRGILDRGFFALLDPKDRVIFQTGATPFLNRVQELAGAAARGEAVGRDWVIETRIFPSWDYEVVAALYLPDVNLLTFEMMARAYGITAVVLLGLLIASYGLASRLSGALVAAEQSRLDAVDAQVAAEAANRTKSTFLANMSHELRTPMNAIIGYSEMLIEDAEDLDQTELVPDLQKIRGAGKHLLALINDILDLSKIEAGKMTIFVEEIPLLSMVEDVTSTIQPLMTKNSNQLLIDVPSDIGSIRADLTKVRQTLFNLLSNASKFTERGTVTLRLRRALSEQGERIHIEVTDTGIGMTPVQLAKLFQAFSQADASTTRKYGGTGLGLIISRKFCQLMGGDISVQSKPGEGTTFTVDLPVVVQEVVPSPPLAPGLSVDARRVLVIDDDPEASELMCRKLQKVGFQVLTAQSGIEGLELAHSQRPDAITLDVMMPGMDGWSVLTALKGDPETASIPVIMVTMLQDQQMGYALGADDFITKPVETAKLRQVLARHINVAGAHVLVVEDDVTNREMLVRMLSKEGLIVAQAENGSQALEQLAVIKPSIILLDLMMPVMDGFEFLKIIRENPDLDTIPVIVVTARDLNEADRNRLNGSVHEVIQKGAMDREKLLSEVATMLAKQAPTPKPEKNA